MVQQAIFHLLDEPVPTLADPFPNDDQLPGAYELHLPSDGVTIWAAGSGLVRALSPEGQAGTSGGN